jgi:LemA protein
VIKTSLHNRHTLGFFEEGNPNMRSTYAKLLLVPVAAASLASCGINSVPTTKINAETKWADVENTYQRRADLVPNLVEAVKGAMQQEKDVLVGVTEARAKATSIQINGADLSDPAKMEQYQQAQAGLGQSLGRLLASVEAYPQIKSNENVLALQSQLEGTENRITVARRDYNEAVRVYNTTISTFPDIIGAKVVHGAKPMVPFKATTANAQEAPKIDLTPAK